MTHDISRHPYFSHDEFIAFLLRYAADADMQCTDAEREMIRSAVDPAHLGQIEEEYNRLTDFERINVIQLYRPQFFSSPEQKAAVLQVVENLFRADGNFDTLEHNAYMMLNRIL